jgi:anti-anti-sigma factor
VAESDLSLVVRRRRRVAVLHGELDLAARELLEAGALAAVKGLGSAGFALDLGGITFIDVAGLEVVTELYAASGAEPPIHLLAASAPVQRLITLLGVEQAFRIEPES